jgi:hypothetical protein
LEAAHSRKPLPHLRRLQAGAAQAHVSPVRRSSSKRSGSRTEKGGEHPIVFDSTLSNPSLELKVYGPTAKELLLTGAANDELNPTHVWTGMCTSPCAVAFRHKTQMADLSGLARMRWNTKVSGFHQIRPIVKLADGTWLVGDRPTARCATGSTPSSPSVTCAG